MAEKDRLIPQVVPEIALFPASSCPSGVAEMSASGSPVGALVVEIDVLLKDLVGFDAGERCLGAQGARFVSLLSSVLTDIRRLVL